MIRIESLTAKDFRGLRRLTLNPNGKNFGICGFNGTGKSGVVDAIEFALTGNITRLTGQGTSGISIKSHAPHVDGRNQPEQSAVKLVVSIPSLDKRVTIERHVGDPTNPTVTPNDADILNVIAEVGRHPEFALSRREIIKYVITPPGLRSKEVQALLRLDTIERLRLALTKVANSCNRDLARYTADVSQTQLRLLRALGIDRLRKEDVLAAVNERRKLLQLDPLADLQRDTSLAMELVTDPRSPVATPQISKKQTLVEIDRIVDLVTRFEPTEVTDHRESALSALSKLRQNPTLLRNLKRYEFLTTGLTLVEDDACPLCDTSWDVTALRKLIAEKIAAGTEAASLRRSVQEALAPFAKILVDFESLTSSLLSVSKRLPTVVDVDAIAAWFAALGEERKRLSSISNLEDVIKTISERWPQGDERALKAIASLKQNVEALPELSSQEEAKLYLTIANERLEVYRLARRKQELWGKRAEVAQQILQIYDETSNAALNKIYRNVEEDFSKFYRFINRDDEATFEGKLTPSLGKLGFDVDFYGRGLFPPGAYHSEGHQDSMGLCLYLALMRHTLGAQFTFAVLDDVLMSVDTGHRREVCALLKLEFGETQLIFTTHDPVWLQHMKTEQLITAKSSIHFHKWTVDARPTVWAGQEVWEDIAHALETENVSGAAGTLRRFLEYTATHLSDRLRATIEFHGDGQYDLGELLPAATQAWRKVLGRSKDSAQSWGKKEEMQQIAARQEEFSSAVERSRVEQWVINRSIHYNEWANLREQDFVPVVDTFKNLVKCFQCQSCGGFFYVSPQKGQQESVRCDCGLVNFNLKKRP